MKRGKSSHLEVFWSASTERGRALPEKSGVPSTLVRLVEELEKRLIEPLLTEIQMASSRERAEMIEQKYVNLLFVLSRQEVRLAHAKKMLSECDAEDQLAIAALAGLKYAGNPAGCQLCIMRVEKALRYVVRRAPQVEHALSLGSLV